MRLSRHVNMKLLGAAVSAPGIDTSCWVSMARVDSEEDALTWEEGIGWIVDVTLHGGKLDGSPLTCRVASSFSSSGEAASCPVDLGAEVVVLLPGDGNPNDTPTIIAQVANNGYAQVPVQIFDEVIDLAFVRATHFMVSTKDLKLQVGKVARVDATESAGLHAPAVTLADPEADQAYVRGNDFAQAMGTFLDGCGTFSSVAVTALDLAAAASVGPLAALKAQFTALGVAFATWGGTSAGFVSTTAPPIPKVPFASSAAGVLKAKLVSGQVLSTKIKGQ